MFKKALFFFTLIVASLTSFASQIPSYPFIHTTGFAYITVLPDIGEIMFEINATDADAELAFGIAASRMTEIQGLLVQQGLLDADVLIRDMKKRIIRSEPVKDGATENYEISCDVTIKVRDLSKWKDIMTPLIKLKNVGKFSTAFDASERVNIEADLAGAALSDARRKAAVLVDVAGKRLGAATAISEGRIKNLGSSIGLVTEGRDSTDRDMRRLAQGDDLLVVELLKLQAAIDVIFEMKPKSGK